MHIPSFLKIKLERREVGTLDELFLGKSMNIIRGSKPSQNPPMQLVKKVFIVAFQISFVIVETRQLFDIAFITWNITKKS